MLIKLAHSHASFPDLKNKQSILSYLHAHSSGGFLKKTKKNVLKRQAFVVVVVVEVARS